MQITRSIVYKNYTISTVTHKTRIKMQKKHHKYEKNIAHKHKMVATKRSRFFW